MNEEVGQEERRVESLSRRLIYATTDKQEVGSRRSVEYNRRDPFADAYVQRWKKAVKSAAWRRDKLQKDDDGSKRERQGETRWHLIGRLWRSCSSSFDVDDLCTPAVCHRLVEWWTDGESTDYGMFRALVAEKTKKWMPRALFRWLIRAVKRWLEGQRPAQTSSAIYFLLLRVSLPRRHSVLESS